MQFALAVALIVAQAGADDTLREMMRLKMVKSMMERQFQDVHADRLPHLTSNSNQ